MFAKIANNRKLEEATSAKDDVAPMYVLDEIAQLASGGGEVAQSLAEASIKRLSNRSPIVKQKALRLIKHVSNKGAVEYRRAICKQAKDIRELQHYRGDPDPFKGDVLNQKVRDAAKGTLDAIFQATDTNYSASSSKPTLTNRIQGFGSTNPGDSDHGSSSRGNMSSYSGGFSNSSSSHTNGNSSGGGMVGFGNPRFNNASSGKPAASSGPSKWLPASVANKLDNLNMLPKDRTGGLRFEGNHGYSSGDDSPQRHSSNSSYTRPPMPSESQRPALASTSTRSYSQASPSGRTGDEAQLVNDMCTPGGLRAQPDREDLRLFVENAASLNGTTVAELLQAKMEKASWQEVLRALCALEAVISQGSSAACGEIAVHFQANAEVVRNAMKSPQASVRQCAIRVFKVLGGDTLPESSQAPAAAAPAAPDLMDDLLGEEEAPAAAAPQDYLGDLLGDSAAATPPSAAAPDSGGMFAGLDIGTNGHSAPSAAAAAPASLLSELGDPSAAPQSPVDALAGLQGLTPAGGASQTAQTDIFGGLSLEAPAAGPTQSSMDALIGLSSPQAAAQPASAGASADLFGGLAVGDSSASTSQASNRPSGAATAGDLDGLFSSVSATAQAHSPRPGPELWPPSSPQGSSPQAGMTGQQGFAQPGMQPGMGLQPGSSMGFMPGYPGNPMQSGMMQPGMMLHNIPPGMLAAMQAVKMGLGPGGMPSGQIPMNPSNPMQGMQGIPNAQMEYLQRQMQGMGMQQPSGLGQQHFAGLQTPGVQMQSAGSGLSDFLSGTGPQGSSPSIAGGKTDLLGRALSSHKQDSFDFIGEHMGTLKK